MSPGEIWHLDDPELDPNRPGEKHFGLVAAKQGTLVDVLWITSRGRGDSIRLCKENFPEDFALTNLDHSSYLLPNPISGDFIVDSTGKQIGDIKGYKKGYACGAILEAGEKMWDAPIKLESTHPEYQSMKDKVVAAAAHAIIIALERPKKNKGYGGTKKKK